MQPIVTPEEMAAIDASAHEPVDVLIDRAGGAVARVAFEMLDGAYGKRVVVLAGPGNNGADGRAAGRRLRSRGVGVQVIDAAAMPGTLPAADLVIDAAYGTGFRGTFHAPMLAHPHTPVLAVDIPSGVSGLTGVVSGTSLPAVRTVTLVAWKPGLLLADGPGLAGHVDVADIGLDTSSARTHLVTAADVAAWLPLRPRAAHKWQGAVWLVAGSAGMTGAAQLAARSAQRGGAGYVRLSVPGAGLAVDAPTEAVVVAVEHRGWAAQVLADQDRFGALAVGPGLGRDPATDVEVRALVAATQTPTVVDGDGLRALGVSTRDVLYARRHKSVPIILTPHDGEFEALAGHPPGADRFEAVRSLSAELGAIVLLKGPTTLVARPDGAVLASATGDARLATAGTGDVLTGLIAALVAQGVEPFRAASAAAFLHGVAGDLALPRGLVAGDLVDHLPAAFAEVAGD